MTKALVREEIVDAIRRELPVRIIFKKYSSDFVSLAVARLIIMSDAGHISLKQQDIDRLKHEADNREWLSKKEKDRTVVFKINEGFDLNTFLFMVEPGIYLIEVYEGHF